MRFLKYFRAQKTTFSHPLAPEEPFFAVGDIHGRHDLLLKIEARMRNKSPTSRRIFVGDYIDRGEESAAVLRTLQTIQASDPSVICLMGNHEHMLLQFLDAPALRGPAWMRHGGIQTLASYAIAPAATSARTEQWEDVRDKLRDAMGPTSEAWLRGLPTSWSTGNIAVVHAGADPALPLPIQPPQTLIWGHPAFETTLRQDNTWVVHGHTIVDEAVAEKGRIAVDTGAYATGRLTAAFIEPGSATFLVA